MIEQEFEAVPIRQHLVEEQGDTVRSYYVAWRFIACGIRRRRHRSIHRRSMLFTSVALLVAPLAESFDSGPFVS